MPGGVRGQVGRGPGQPGLVLNVEAGSPACGGAVVLDDPWSPFQPKPFYGSMILCAQDEARLGWSGEMGCEAWGG